MILDTDWSIPSARPLSDNDIAIIIEMAWQGRPQLDIARAIERSTGTIATTMHRLRREGRIGAARRYVRRSA